MTPFVQELISFISLMLGVIVLTAWVMWLVLRPSGDTRVKEFSQESARDGLTQCVIENNELNNKVTRLEREIKVLMNAGYGGAKGKEDEHKTNDDEAKTAVEGLKAKDKVPGPEKNIVAEGKLTKPAAAKETAQKATGEVTRTVVKQAAKPAATAGKQDVVSAVKTGQKSTTTNGTPSAPGSTPVQKAGAVASDAGPVAKDTVVVNKQVAGSPVKTMIQPTSSSDASVTASVKPAQKPDAVTEDARPVARKNAVVDKQSAGSPVKTTLQPTSSSDASVTASVKPAQKPDAVTEDARPVARKNAAVDKQSSDSPVKTTLQPASSSDSVATPSVKPVKKSDAVTDGAGPVVKETATVNKQVSGSPAKAAVKPASTTDSISAPLPTPVQRTDEVVNEAADDEASDELKRLIEEAEKQKIADYMANVEKAAERQKKEVEALAAKVEAAEKVRYANNNLKRIKGIGPHLEVMLKKSGITSYQQIAEFNEQDIQRVSDEIGSFPRRIKREAWVEQAKILLGKG